jgi:hypothetical protein
MKNKRFLKKKGNPKILKNVRKETGLKKLNNLKIEYYIEIIN